MKKLLIFCALLCAVCCACSCAGEVYCTTHTKVGNERETELPKRFLMRDSIVRAVYLTTDNRWHSEIKFEVQGDTIVHPETGMKFYN